MWRVLAMVLVVGAAGGAQADELGVIHAGRWEATFGDAGPNARVMYTCRKADVVMDEKSMASAMGQMAADCSKVDFKRSGDVITYSLVCKSQNMTITSSGTTTFAGPDSFTTVSHTHMEGGTMQMPDHDMTMHFRRVGAECQPTDRVVK